MLQSRRSSRTAMALSLLAVTRDSLAAAAAVVDVDVAMVSVAVAVVTSGVVVVAAVVVEEEEHLGIRIQLFPDKGKKRISPVERIIIDDSRGLKRSRGEAVWLGDLAENEHDDGYVALCINE